MLSEREELRGEPGSRLRAKDGGMSRAVEISISAGSCLVFALAHWQFRTGWQMNAGRLEPSRAMRDVTIRLMYGALPGMISTGSLALLFVLAWLTSDSLSGTTKGLAIALALTFVGSGCWLAKESYAPTKRRAPQWLQPGDPGT